MSRLLSMLAALTCKSRILYTMCARLSLYPSELAPMAGELRKSGHYLPASSLKSGIITRGDNKSFSGD